MIEILQFIFQSGWHFIGTLILIMAFSGILKGICITYIIDKGEK